MKILVLNGGSSSLKCWYHEVTESALDGPAPHPLWQEQIDWTVPGDIDAVLRAVPGGVDVVGHRVVHGGRFHDSAVLTQEVRAAIAEETSIAPAHNQLVLAAVQAVERVFGSQVKQVAVFDTAFHASMAPAAYVYPGPYSWLEEGIRRYGFHGISHSYAARRAAQLLKKDPASLRLVTCHLGSGASLAAVRGGVSIDTTMGFTPLEGLMMGSRSGSIDPGILIHLIRRHGYSADQLDNILYHESGLFGVSGISADMREILAAIAQGNERARLAFDLYTHRLVREIGSMIAVLGGADALVFTGGVGENCVPLREAVLRQFGFLKDLRVLVIHAEEEWEIARQGFRLAK
jgi:acetate kinase